MVRPLAILGAAGGYLKQHPEEVLRVARNAMSLRFGLPIAALRWLASELGGKNAPKDLLIESRPPGIHVGASFELMKTPLRASGTVYVERVNTSPKQLVVELRLSDVSLKVQSDQVDTPIAALLRSGALDLSQAGKLAAYMPKRPAFLIDAKDDRVVLDLMKLKRLREDERVRRLVALVTQLLAVRAVQTEPEHLDVLVEAFPGGVAEVLGAVRRYL